jgi:hypothetical protein
MLWGRGSTEGAEAPDEAAAALASWGVTVAPAVPPPNVVLAYPDARELHLPTYAAMVVKSLRNIREQEQMMGLVFTLVVRIEFGGLPPPCRDELTAALKFRFNDSPLEVESDHTDARWRGSLYVLTSRVKLLDAIFVGEEFDYDVWKRFPFDEPELTFRFEFASHTMQSDGPCRGWRVRYNVHQYLGPPGAARVEGGAPSAAERLAAILPMLSFKANADCLPAFDVRHDRLEVACAAERKEGRGQVRRAAPRRAALRRPRRPRRRRAARAAAGRHAAPAPRPLASRRARSRSSTSRRSPSASRSSATRASCCARWSSRSRRAQPARPARPPSRRPPAAPTLSRRCAATAPSRRSRPQVTDVSIFMTMLMAPTKYESRIDAQVTVLLALFAFLNFARSSMPDVPVSTWLDWQIFQSVSLTLLAMLEALLCKYEYQSGLRLGADGAADVPTPQWALGAAVELTPAQYVSRVARLALLAAMALLSLSSVAQVVLRMQRYRRTLRASTALTREIKRRPIDFDPAAYGWAVHMDVAGDQAVRNVTTRSRRPPPALAEEGRPLPQPIRDLARV